MGNYIPIETEGGIIWAEIDDAGGYRMAGIPEGIKHSFREAADILKKNAEYLLKALKKISPDEIEINFGMKAGVEGGVSFFGLAKASGEASYTVKLKWKPEKTTNKHKEGGEKNE